MANTDTNGGTLKACIIEHVTALNDPKAGVVKRYREDNRGPLLSDIYFWQVIGKLAEEREKAAWAAAQEDGFIPTDDQLRSKAQGEHIVAESKQFSCLATINNPRKNFNLGMFIDELVKKHKLKAPVLEAMAERCKVPGTAPLSKRVVEV